MNPSIYKKGMLNKYKGKRIAVDAYIWLHENYSVAQKAVLEKTNVLEEEADPEKIFQILLNKFFDFYLKLLHINTLLVLNFDGNHIPEKLGTQQRRAKTRDKTKERIKELEAKLNSKDVLELDEADADELRKLKAQYINIEKFMIVKFKQITLDLGIPYFQCKGEGEKTCAMLCRDGICAANLGKDSDLTAYGGRFILSQIRYEGESIDGTPFYTVMELDLVEVLTTLELSHNQFVDFCILLGTDYNIRIKGIGPVTALKLIKEHKSIENIQKTGKDISCLNLNVCRNEFEEKKYTDTIESGSYTIREANPNIVKELEQYGLGIYYGMIQEAHKKVQVTDADKEVNNEFENLYQEKIVFKLVL